MSKIKIDAFSLLEKIRKQKPLAHHLTNWVTIYDCANIVKVLGASPVMAHAPQEAGEMARLAHSLVLNIGTLTADFVEAMKIAAASANQKGIPVVLDVCGCGATSFRDAKVSQLLGEVKIDIIKGNVSEIARVAGENVKTKGVDASMVEKNMIEIARILSTKRKATVVATGKEDIVTDGVKTYIVKNGHQLLTRVVGTGCMAASVIGTFSAVEEDLAFAATSGLLCFEIAAQIAAKKASGPASFKEKLFDCLFKLDKKTIFSMQRVEKV
ncbi:MAG: hydroxyethylthiazole kinase [Candidatus Omnitrophica bacterium]|nr:hydroxyethylthiazole kinase [Candidatus Omnitrophota bacterium]